jgi:hypothetical protein
MTFFVFDFSFRCWMKLALMLPRRLVFVVIHYTTRFQLIIFLFIMLTWTEFGSCQQHQKVKLQGRTERMPAGMFLFLNFAIKQEKYLYIKPIHPWLLSQAVTSYSFTESDLLNQYIRHDSDLWSWGMTGFSFAVFANGIKHSPKNTNKKETKNSVFFL